MHKFLKSVWENAKIIIFALFLTFLIKTFLVQPFHIPSGSMKPGLLPGDYIFVNKFSYGYSKFSFYGLYPKFLLNPDESKDSSKYAALFPKFLSSNGRFFDFESRPKRGDVIVFIPPKIIDKEKEFYIKRIIGAPHDLIEIKNQRLYINGKELEEVKLKDDQILNFKKRLTEDFEDFGSDIEFLEETNPDGKKYDVMYVDERETMKFAKFFVPEGHFFVMGDNRDNSLDGRYLDQVGYIPFQNIIGKASFVFFSFDKDSFSFSKIKDLLRFERFFKRIG